MSILQNYLIYLSVNLFMEKMEKINYNKATEPPRIGQISIQYWAVETVE